jgi:hypothetical protein
MLLFLVLSGRPGFAGKSTMLTYIQINAAKPRKKAWGLSDSQGLLLQIQPNGSKLWRFKYRFLDKQKALHLGRLALIEALAPVPAMLLCLALLNLALRAGPIVAALLDLTAVIGTAVGCCEGRGCQHRSYCSGEDELLHGVSP